MKKIFPSSQYKKDYKCYRNQPKKLTALGEVIDMLTSEEPIPADVEKYVGAFSACQTVDWKKDKEEFRTFYLLSIAIFGSSVAHAFQCVGASPCSSPRFPAWESCYAVLPLSRWEA